MGETKLSFKKNTSGFFSEVKKKVNTYFKENNISKNANAEMIFKSFFFLGGALTFYLMILLGGFSAPVTIILALLLGAFMAFIGFNVGHDAIHGAYSKNNTINKIMGLSFNIAGANDYVWSITHNLVHHTYTNIPGHDEDIEVAPGLIRLSPDDKLKGYMRFQQFYAFLLYGLASLSWVIRKDYKKFFQKKIGQYSNKHTTKNYINLFFFKALYYFLFIALPIILLPFAWWQVLLGFVLMHFSQGLVLGLVFQLAHVVEGTAFPTPNEEGNIEEAWVIHQMQTTADFARKNIIADFLCGGLNFQIEHHLFPKVCHVHYKNICKIVERTALEHGVPYISNETFLGATKSHFKMLKQFGRA